MQIYIWLIKNAGEGGDGPCVLRLKGFVNVELDGCQAQTSAHEDQSAPAFCIRGSSQRPLGVCERSFNKSSSGARHVPDC